MKNKHITKSQRIKNATKSPRHQIAPNDKIQAMYFGEIW